MKSRFGEPAARLHRGARLPRVWGNGGPESRDSVLELIGSARRLVEPRVSRGDEYRAGVTSHGDDHRPPSLQGALQMTDPSPDELRESLTGDLLQDAFVEPDWDRFLTGLAGIAVSESWAPPGDPSDSMRVLSSVVRYTYRRAVATGRVSVGRGERGQTAVVFASGLYTPGLELLYCVGGATEARQNWAVKGVETAVRAARRLGSSQVPQSASFWEDSCELVLDPKADFFVDIEDLARRENVNDVMPDAIASLPDMTRIGVLEGAISRARRLAELNPRVVAPAFNFKGRSGDGELTLLLPLNLASEAPDAALVLKEIYSETDQRVAYRGAAIIDIGRAYTSARVVGPLDSVWAQAQTAQ